MYAVVDIFLVPSSLRPKFKKKKKKKILHEFDRDKIFRFFEE